VILAVWFWRAGHTADPERAWHFTAAAAHTLLATCNILLWSIFVICDVLPLGYVSTGVHCVFAVLQLWAALSRSPRTVPA
jgi:hypothetical protein